jgi:hypothetical protein
MVSIAPSVKNVFFIISFVIYCFGFPVVVALVVLVVFGVPVVLTVEPEPLPDPPDVWVAWLPVPDIPLVPIPDVPGPALGVAIELDDGTVTDCGCVFASLLSLISCCVAFTVLLLLFICPAVFCPFICADAIPNVSTAPSVKNNFFMTLAFLLQYKINQQIFS